MHRYQHVWHIHHFGNLQVGEQGYNRRVTQCYAQSLTEFSNHLVLDRTLRNTAYYSVVKKTGGKFCNSGSGFLINRTVIPLSCKSKN